MLLAKVDLWEGLMEPGVIRAGRAWQAYCPLCFVSMRSSMPLSMHRLTKWLSGGAQAPVESICNHKICKSKIKIELLSSICLSKMY